MPARFPGAALAVPVVLSLAGAALAHEPMPNMGHSSGADCNHLHVHDAYARVASPMARSGAAFMILHNHGGTDDRVLAARSDIAERVELHRHVEDARGVMRMVEVEEGFPLPAGGGHVLARGGDHVMFLGLVGTLQHGDEVAVTLVYESGCEVHVDVPVDLQRGGSHTHGHGSGHRH